ncbi:MAG: hydroxymethylbilane synthase [Candidatus Krumholzibacteriota bacterium]|nr:hydroxymethylbilane synthase [Candidatus Krumholzibacteriota bacterium]
MKTLRIGIRKSRVAELAVAKVVAELREENPKLAVEIVPYETGVRYSAEDSESYIQELEEALRRREVDLVVHLLKEIPVRLPEDIQLIGASERINPFDAFVSRDYQLIEELPPGARVGVSHQRQRAQLLLHRYDLEIVELHGSVDSRLQQMESQELAGLILSAESLERLGLQGEAREIVREEILLPAPGQGCLGFLARRGEEDLVELVAPLQDQTSRLETVAERAFLDRLGGNPELPLGVHAACDSYTCIIEGVLATPDSSSFIRDAIQGPRESAELIGTRLAELLLVLGDEELLALVEAPAVLADADDDPGGDAAH